MKILVVASGNHSKSSFVLQQAQAISKQNVQVDFFWIKGKGILGYLKNIIPLIKKIKEPKCDLIHAHYGLSGLLSCLQIKKPVVVTFHGSDIEILFVRWLSFLAVIFSSKNIFVHKDLIKKTPFLKNKSRIIPCGVELDIFYKIDRQIARQKMGFDENCKYILFSSFFENKVKNHPLAKSIVSRIDTKVKLIELS